MMFSLSPDLPAMCRTVLFWLPVLPGAVLSFITRLPAAPLLLVLMGWMVVPVPAGAAEVTLREARLDGEGRFEVTAALPAGYASAALEVRAGDGAWRTMIAGTVDGRAAAVVFRLPLATVGASAMARVRCASGGPLPAAELADPALYSVLYDTAGNVEESVKLDNLAALMRKHHEWSGLPHADRNAALIAHALTLPRVSGAGFSPLAGTVYINYPDGDTSVIIDNRGPSAVAAAAPVPSAGGASAAVQGNVSGEAAMETGHSGQAARIRSGTVGPRSGEKPKKLPQSLEAICAYGLEPEIFPDSTPQVAGWLSAAGYSVQRYSPPTVDDILSWKNRRAGVVFWQTHTGSLQASPTEPQQMCIVTGQRATVELSQGRYKSMRSGPVWLLLLAARPDYANPSNTAGIPIYALTEAFVKNEMTGMFAEHSLCALDACTGADVSLAVPFLNNGAGAHVSWDNLSGVDSGTRFRQLFDRLTGRNAEAPLALPKERPFSMQAVQEWMQNYAFDLDPSPQDPRHPAVAALVWRYHEFTPAFALLPGVMRVLFTSKNPQWNFTKLTIEGDFGDDPGPADRLVTWGDQILQVLDWKQDTGIIVKPPPAPHPQGGIQVMIGPRRGNSAPVTQWTVPFTYTLNGEGSLQYRLELMVTLRGNIHRGRSLPGEEPLEYPVVIYQLVDCSGTMTASGQYREDENTTITWSGSKTLQSFETLGSTPPAGDFVVAAGTMSPSTGTISNFFLSTVTTFTETVTTPSGSKSTVRGALLDGFLLPLTLQVNPASSVLQGRTLTAAFPLSMERGVEASLSWPDVTPAAGAPDGETQH